jgi:hypothetical protein
VREHLGKHGMPLHALRTQLAEGGWQEGAWSTRKIAGLGAVYEGTWGK